MEKNIAYMMGYGFFVSFVCNVCLNGDFSRGAYFVLSQWMIINCLLFEHFALTSAFIPNK